MKYLFKKHLVLGWSWSYFHIGYNKLIYHRGDLIGHQFELGWFWIQIFPRGKYR